MEPPQDHLWHIGKAIRQTLSDESKILDPIRVARQGLVEQVALRNCSPSERRSSSWFPRMGWAVAAFGILCAAGFAIAFSRRPIGFAIDGRPAPGRPGEVIEANSNSPLAVAFTEGSALLLHEGGRMRVLSLQKDGARVLVESGALDVAIPRPPRLASWQFELGPFQVSLAGSKFRAAWDPADERLSLYVREGSVVVSGRCIGGRRTVGAGQYLDVLCPPGPAQPSALVRTANTGDKPRA